MYSYLGMNVSMKELIFITSVVHSILNVIFTMNFLFTKGECLQTKMAEDYAKYLKHAFDIMVQVVPIKGILTLFLSTTGIAKLSCLSICYKLGRIHSNSTYVVIKRIS